jgi:hypothetical protein
MPGKAGPKTKNTPLTGPIRQKWVLLTGIVSAPTSRCAVHDPAVWRLGRRTGGAVPAPAPGPLK